MSSRGGVTHISSLARAIAGLIVLAMPFAANCAEPAEPPVQEIVVTGSRIPRPNLTSVSPLATVAATEIASEGLARVEDVVARLPQAFVGQSSTDSNGATGTATVDLRGLGAERTLVLIDGRRLMPGDPTSGSIAPDLNFIPASLVDRIEIVTGGTSAVYGSDAIAGVVNFIMKRGFSGLQLDASAGGYDHVNGQTGLQAVIAGQGYALPERHVDGGLTYDLTLSGGVNFADGRGNLTVYGGYRRADAIVQSSRDFSACAFQSATATPVCQGSTRSTELGRFAVFDSSFQSFGTFTLDPTGPGDTLRRFNNARDAYNFQPYNYFQRPDLRWVGGGFAHYQVSAKADVYVQAMFMDDSSTAQVAASGLFANTPTMMACDSPLLSAAEVQAFCTRPGVAPGGQALLFLGRRNVEGGPRRFVLDHRDWRILAGVKGQLGDWNYSVSGQYGTVRSGELILNEVSVSHAADALDVVRNASGALVCASGHPGCAPYDIFRIGGVTQAALDYIDVPSRANGSTGETVLSAEINGQLGRYGLKSPWATDGLGVAFGAEYRRESLAYEPDAELASGDLASSAEAEPPVSGAFHVFDVYGELRAPLAEDTAPWLHEATLEAGVRFSRYNAAGSVWTYKAGGEFAPTEDLRLRVSFNHAVRAPTVVDLYTPQTVSSAGLQIDPCAGPDPLSADPAATPANCARTGVTASQYGAIASNDEGYNSLVGGNPKLTTESSDSVTLGVVLTPSFAPGLTLSVDGFDIDAKNVLGVVGADQIIEQCLQTGDPFFCSQVHRAPGTGSLWFGKGYVSDIVQNASSMRVRGVDIEAGYRHVVPPVGGRDLGTISVQLVGTFVDSFTLQNVPSAAAFDCAGLFGFTCGTPLPRWRHSFSVTWSTPWRVDVSGHWRYTSRVDLDALTSDPQLARPVEATSASLDARSYFDFSLSWSPRRALTLRAGINNAFDQDPPIFGGAGNGNTYPGIYDALGRFVFVGVTAKL